MPYKDIKKMKIRQKAYRLANIEKIRLKSRKWAINNKEKYIITQEAAKKRYREFYLGLKLGRGGKCERCGWEEEIRALVWHHVNQHEKKLNIGRASLHPGNYQNLILEIKKCTLLCPNCHAIVHILNGTYGKRGKA